MPIDPLLGTPLERLYQGPQGGWKAKTLYLVAISFGKTNPVHLAYMEVGFLTEEGLPGNYTEVFCNTYDRIYEYNHLYYCRAIKELCSRKEFEHEILET